MTRQSAAQGAAPGFFLSVLKPLFLSLLLTVFALVFLAICIAAGPVTLEAAEPCILVGTAVSVFVAGFLTARGQVSRGFLRGAAAGALYGLLAYAVAALAFSSFSPGSGFIKLWILEILAGAMGGVFGINSRRRKRKA